MSTRTAVEQLGTTKADTQPTIGGTTRRRKRRVNYPHAVNIRVTEQMKTQLERLADLEECSIPDVVRDLLDGQLTAALDAARRRTRRRTRTGHGESA